MLYFTSCTTRTIRKPLFRQLCSSFLSVADDMLFRQLHYSHESYQSKGLPLTTLLTNSTSVSNGCYFTMQLYDSYESYHLTEPPLYTCLMRCIQVMYFTLFHSNVSHSLFEPIAQLHYSYSYHLSLLQ